MAETKETNVVDHVVNVRRVTKVTKGGKRFAFSALVVSGDQQGNIGIALEKAEKFLQQLLKQPIERVKI